MPASLHHSDFLSMLAAALRPRVYLELGLYRGETFFKVQPFVERAIGVDVQDRGIPGEIYVESTDEFFSHFEDEVDLVFIDADHRYESARRDLESSFRILRPAGVIVLHDTDPEEDRLIDPAYCGDSYKIVRYIEREREELNIVTLPLTEAGLSIVTRKRDTRTARRALTRARDEIPPALKGVGPGC